MKKKFTALALVLACVSAFAEESGLFLGIGYGAHGAKQEISFNDEETFVGHIGPNASFVASFIGKHGESHSTTDFWSGFYFGYKHIFDEHSGVRVYLNTESNNIEVQKTNGGTTYRTYNIIGLSVDYLFNFIPSFGAFAGLNFAAISWDKEIWSIDWENDDEEYRGYFAAQLGIRGIFGENKRHAVELYGRLPFTKTTFEYQLPDGSVLAKMTLKQTYNVGLRYIYTFSMD